MSGIVVSRIEAGDSPWHPANNGTGKRIWFLSRVVDGVTEYHWAKARPPADLDGALIRYARYETALQAAERLNQREDRT